MIYVSINRNVVDPLGLAPFSKVIQYEPDHKPVDMVGYSLPEPYRKQARRGIKKEDI